MVSNLRQRVTRPGLGVDPVEFGRVDQQIDSDRRLTKEGQRDLMVLRSKKQRFALYEKNEQRHQ